MLQFAWTVNVSDRSIFDAVFSNHEQYGIWLWEETKTSTGWSREVLFAKRGAKPAEQELPPIVRADGSNNGFWVHKRELVWMNEDTATSKDLVERRSFDQLLANVEPGPKSPEASLKMMQVKPGYRVELVAAEPLVRDPVAFDWGPDGKLWVAEMADYPLGLGRRRRSGCRGCVAPGERGASAPRSVRSPPGPTESQANQRAGLHRSSAGTRPVTSSAAAEFDSSKTPMATASTTSPPCSSTSSTSRTV